MSQVVGRAAHDEAVARLRASYDAIPAGAPVRLAKRTSNLFRSRSSLGTPGLDVSGLGGVVSVDVRPDGSATADVQGMCTYEDLVDVTLPRGYIPLVVPQLRSITLGGAVTGLGIESTSFRNGLPHESVLEMDVLTGAGEIVTTRPGDDLFDAFPNSYGSLGYATRLRIELEKVPGYVDLRHLRFDDLDALAKTVAVIVEHGEHEGVRVDGLDGVVFEPGAADGDGNRAVEARVTELGGHKSLYSDAYYDRVTFDRLYGVENQRKVKQQTDPEDRLTGLYEKAVNRR